MSFLGSVASAVGSVVGSWLGGKQAAQSATALSAKNYQRASQLAQDADMRSLSNSKQLFQYQNKIGPSLAVEGYKKAGINPILVGDFNPSMPSFNAAVGDFTPEESRGKYYMQNAQAITNALQMIHQSELFDSQVAQNDANARAVLDRAESERMLANAKVDALQAQAHTEMHKHGYYDASAARMREQIGLLSLQGQRIRQELANNENYVDLMKSRIELNRALSKRDHVGFGNHIRLNFNMNDIIDAGVNGAKQLFDAGGSFAPRESSSWE